MSMASVPPGAETGAAALLAAEARAGRARLVPPILIGLAIAACGIAQAFLIARLLATLLGRAEAGWTDLAAAGVLALLMAALGVAQERAQQAAGEEAKARLRERLFARLLAAGPADERAVGEKSALVVERVEAMEGYFSRWIPAAALALLAPLLIAGAAAFADPLSGLILLGAGLLVPVAQAVSGIGAGLASRRQFAALQALSGRFLDRMRGLPVLVLFNQQDAEARRLGAAAEELRGRTMRVLRLAFIATGAMELIIGIALASLAYRHGHLVAGTHPAPVTALFCLLLVPVFFAPLRAFAGAYHEQLAARGAAADLAPLLAAPDSEDDLFAGLR